MNINSVIDFISLMDTDERISGVSVEHDEEKNPREQCCYIHLKDDVQWSDEIAKEWNLSNWEWRYSLEYNTKVIKISLPINFMSFHVFEDEVTVTVNGEDITIKV